MNDRELLELAAKAAEIELNFPQDYGGADFLSPTNVDGWKIWNPLTDDGDALRLAVKLGIHIAFYGDHIAVQQTKTKMITAQARDGDMFGATRRAIVRAAAEIGKAMQ